MYCTDYLDFSYVLGNTCTFSISSGQLVSLLQFPFNNSMTSSWPAVHQKGIRVCYSASQTVWKIQNASSIFYDSLEFSSGHLGQFWVECTSREVKNWRNKHPSIKTRHWFIQCHYHHLWTLFTFLIYCISCKNRETKTNRKAEKERKRDRDTELSLIHIWRCRRWP